MTPETIKNELEPMNWNDERLTYNKGGRFIEEKYLYCFTLPRALVNEFNKDIKGFCVFVANLETGRVARNEWLSTLLIRKTVDIYTDPVSCNTLEGKALVISIKEIDDYFIHCTVKFLSDGFITDRKLNIKNF